MYSVFDKIKIWYGIVGFYYQIEVIKSDLIDSILCNKKETAIKIKESLTWKHAYL